MRLTPEFVCVREGSRENIVVFLPGLHAPASQLALLASRVGGSGAVYILDLLALCESEREVSTVEYLAKRGLCLVNEIGDAVALIGYSFGGLVALEMARLAGSAGGRAPRLILIDAAPEQSFWPRTAWLSSLSVRTVRHIKALGGLPPKQAAAEFGLRARALVRRLQRRRSVAASLAGAVQKVADPATGITARPTAARMVAAANLYRPAPYAGRVTLIESSDPPFAMPVSRIWRPLMSELKVLQYSGGHLDAVSSEAAVESLVAQLNACLGLTE
jgi:thioesterase domain-containing protein